MHSTQEATRPMTQQTLFDTDAYKFLIDSGASTHMWNQRKDFISYKVLSKEEQKKEQVIGISGDMIQPFGVGSVCQQVEDDLNEQHTIELHNVMHMPDAPINILVPQVFIQQCQSEGDALANCSISATGITLEWLADSGTTVTKYNPLNQSNVGIAYKHLVSRTSKPLHHCVVCQPISLMMRMIPQPPHYLIHHSSLLHPLMMHWTHLHKPRG